MKLNRIVMAVALCALMTVAAYAADLNGTWVVKQPGRDGNTVEVNYTFKVDGAKLTGKVSNPQGDVEIKDGKVDGASFEFSIERPGRDGNTMTIKFTGKLDGDTITLSRQGRGGQAQEMKGERKK